MELTLRSQCLWKVSKTVKESLENHSLSPARLLRVINDFLVAIPPAEWRRRATDGIALADMPLRTLKTILSAVVSVCDKKVTEELYEIEEAENSYVYHYLVRMLNNSANGPPPSSTTTRFDSDATRGTSTAPAPRGLPPPVAAEVAPSRPANLSEGAIDIATNRELSTIFERIGDPGQSRLVRFDYLLLLEVVLISRMNRRESQNCTHIARSILSPTQRFRPGQAILQLLLTIC